MRFYEKIMKRNLYWDAMDTWVKKKREEKERKEKKKACSTDFKQ